MKDGGLVIGPLVMMAAMAVGASPQIADELRIMAMATGFGVPAGWIAEVIEARLRKTTITREERAAKWLLAIMLAGTGAPEVFRYFEWFPWPSRIGLVSIGIGLTAWASVLLVRTLWLKVVDRNARVLLHLPPRPDSDPPP